jgi:hypothetical protein
VPDWHRLRSRRDCIVLLDRVSAFYTLGRASRTGGRPSANATLVNVETSRNILPPSSCGALSGIILRFLQPLLVGDFGFQGLSLP